MSDYQPTCSHFVTAVIFDAEGVVIDTEPLWDAVQAEFLMRRGYTYQRNVVKPLLTGRTVSESTAVLKQMFDLPEPLEQLVDERVSLMRAMLTGKIRFVPGFLEFYQQVSLTHKVAVATSLDRTLLDLVNRSVEIFDLFGNAIVSPSDVGGKGKPNPDVFLRASELILEPAQRCMVIEDSPAGIQAAQSASMYTVGITTTHPAAALVEADLIISAFQELDLEEVDFMAQKKAGAS